jgi:hypothetical protein
MKTEKSSTPKNGKGKSEANAVISEELEENDSVAFMAYMGER